MTSPEPRRRVLLKLSGEAFGAGSLGVNPDVVSELAREIAAAAKQVEIAIVVGGGNFFRGAELSQRGMDRGRADYMGMLGTVMNALALQDFLEQAGAATRVQSAISMTQVAEPYIPAPRRASPREGPRRHLRRGSRPALLLDRHRRGAARARDRCRTSCSWRRTESTACTTADPRSNPDCQEDRQAHLPRRPAARAQGRRLHRIQPLYGQRDADDGLRNGAPGNVTKAIRGERIGTLVSTSHD